SVSRTSSGTKPRLTIGAVLFLGNFAAMFLIVSHLWERLDVESLTRKGRGSSTRFGRVASVGAKAGVAPNKSTLIPTERRRHTYFVAGCCSTQFGGLDNSRPLVCSLSYPIYSARTSSAGRGRGCRNP